MDWMRRGGPRENVAPGHAHLVGIAGRGMSGLAQLLVQRGMVVTGSEPPQGRALERLREVGVRLHSGHAPRGAQFLVYHPQIPKDHPSRLVASRTGIDQSSVSQWLAGMMHRSIGLTVVGGRLASTTSAMIGWTLAQAGFDPTVVLGASVPQLGGWGRLGAGPHFVAEAIQGPDEIGPGSPRIAILMDNVESAAGWETWGSSDTIRPFLQTVPSDGLILAREGVDQVEVALEGTSCRVEWISLREGEGWWVGDLREVRGRHRFRAFHHDRFVAEIRLQVAGRRNVLGALAALAACEHLEVPVRQAKQALEEFAGLSRDFESRGSYRGVTLVDDEGVDPSSVLETMITARQVFGTRPIRAVLRVSGPGQALGSGVRYSEAFASADQVMVIDGKTSGDCLADSLANDLRASGIPACGVSGLDEAIRELDRNLEPGDVLITLGAGEVGTIADAFIRRLSRNHQG